MDMRAEFDAIRHGWFVAFVTSIRLAIKLEGTKHNNIHPC